MKETYLHSPILLLSVRDQLRTGTIFVYPQIKYSGLFAIRVCAENENFGRRPAVVSSLAFD